MNTYTSETVEFVTLVLASGIMAMAALAVASLIGFTVAFRVFRERAVAAAPASARAAALAVEIQPAIVSAAMPAYAAETRAAVAG